MSREQANQRFLHREILHVGLTLLSAVPRRLLTTQIYTQKVIIHGLIAVTASLQFLIFHFLQKNPVSHIISYAYQILCDFS